MRTWARGVSAVVAVSIFAVPCSADVLGSRPGGNASSERIQVVQRLRALGIDALQAEREVRELSARDLEYFAANASRIVLAGAQEGSGQGEFLSGSSHVMWYEFVGGALFFLVGMGLIWHAITNNEK